MTTKQIHISHETAIRRNSQMHNLQETKINLTDS